MVNTQSLWIAFEWQEGAVLAGQRS